MLSERPDRPATLLAQQELEQHVIASSFKPASLQSTLAADCAAQKSRERAAAALLTQDVSEATALQVFHTYSKKTKADIEEEYTQSGSVHRCKLTYRTILRTISATGEAADKKTAKKRAAAELLGVLTSNAN